eukprot:2778787-Pleurochrysis_carterae.AAC.1
MRLRAAASDSCVKCVKTRPVDVCTTFSTPPPARAAVAGAMTGLNVPPSLLRELSTLLGTRSAMSAQQLLARALSSLLLERPIAPLIAASSIRTRS